MKTLNRLLCAIVLPVTLSIPSCKWLLPNVTPPNTEEKTEIIEDEESEGNDNESGEEEEYLQREDLYVALNFADSYKIGDNFNFSGKAES